MSLLTVWMLLVLLATHGHFRPTMAQHIQGLPSKSFVKLCISFITGIPYNPLGQRIIEHAHHSIKVQTQKQKGGIFPYKIHASTMTSLGSIHY